MQILFVWEFFNLSIEMTQVIIGPQISALKEIMEEDFFIIG